MRADLVLVDEPTTATPEQWDAAFFAAAQAAGRLGDAFRRIAEGLREVHTGGKATGKAARFELVKDGDTVLASIEHPAPPLPPRSCIRWSPAAREVVEPGEKARLLERFADDDARRRLHRSVDAELVRRFQAWAARVEATGRDTPPTP